MAVANIRMPESEHERWALLEALLEVVSSDEGRLFDVIPMFRYLTDVPDRVREIEVALSVLVKYGFKPSERIEEFANTLGIPTEARGKIVPKRRESAR